RHASCHLRPPLPPAAPSSPTRRSSDLTSSARAAAAPAAPRTNGEARCTTSGENSRRALYTLGLGAPTGNDEISGTFTEVTRWTRSEEHTSELQSRFDLVCRLLLEKKHE